ncbi:ABC transporter substrate-binding protein [Tardisphaera miroshnichenkoae]
MRDEIFAWAIAAILLLPFASSASVASGTSGANTASLSFDVAFTSNEQSLGYMLSASFLSSSIRVNPSEVAWDALYLRVASPSLNYSQGGYDSYLLSEALQPCVNPYDAIYSPVGQMEGNMGSYLESRLISYEEYGNVSALMQAESLISDEYLTIPLLYVRPVWALSPGITGFDPTISSYYPQPWLWQGVDNVTYLAYGNPAPSVLPLFGASGLPAYAVFQPLVIPSGTGYAPCLATNWSQDGFKTWYVYLRHGVTFQNGMNMTADDVVWSVKVAMDPLANSPLRPFFEDVLGNSVKFVLSNGTSYYLNGTSYVGEVKAIGSYEVEFELPRPFALFYPLLMSQLFVYPMRVISRYPSNLLLLSSFSRGISAVGTGPYELVSASPGIYVLKAFQGYWNGTPRVHYIRVVYANASPLQVIRLISNGTVQIASYGFGFYDYVKGPYSGVSWSVGQPSIYVGLVLNLHNPVLGNGSAIPASKLNPLDGARYAEQVRQALSCSIPREVLAQAFFAGFAEPASAALTPVQASYLGVSLSQNATYNQSAAVALLSDLGYSATSYDVALEAYPQTAYQGSPIHVIGYVIYAGHTVGDLELTVKGVDKQTFNVTTTAQGTFNATLLLPSGRYYLQAYAVYDGSSLSSNSVGPISVQSWIEANAVYVVVIAIWIALFALLAIRRLWRRRRVFAAGFSS